MNRRGGVAGAATRKALTAVTATMTADTTMTADSTIVAGRATPPVAVGPSPGPDTDRGVRRLVLTTKVAGGADRAGAATVEELLRQRFTLPAADPDRATLRTRGIEAGLPLARSLAARYRGRGEPLEDLYQVAVLALVKAVDGYDPARQVAFTSYAVPTIVGALKRHFRDTTWRVRVPRRVQELAISIGPANAELVQQLGRSPTRAELAAHLGAGEDDVAVAMNSWQFRHPESLDWLSATGGSDRRSFLDTLGAVDVGFEAVTDWHTLQPLLAALPVRERRILALRFFADLTQAEIAVEFGLSQMHISRLLVRVLTQLRAGMLDDEQHPTPPAPDRITARR
jgi:RNA polymerase sigma-B factor